VSNGFELGLFFSGSDLSSEVLVLSLESFSVIYPLLEMGLFFIFLYQAIGSGQKWMRRAVLFADEKWVPVNSKGVSCARYNLYAANCCRI
jgi:hypothetical protein